MTTTGQKSFRLVVCFGFFSIFGLGFGAENEPVSSVEEPTDPGCPNGHKLYGNYCYKFYSNDSFNWPEAEQFCQDSVQGAHLVWITSEQENEFVLALAEKASNFLWLGGRRYCPNQNFYWPNQDEIGPYANWDPKTGTPSLKSTDGCLQMKLDKSDFSWNTEDNTDQRGLWSATDCGYQYGSKTYRTDSKKRYPVCKVPKKGVLAPPPPTDNNALCEFGWCTQDETSCYKLVDTLMSWQAARQSCRTEYQAELASVHSWMDNNITVGMTNAAGMLAYATWNGANKLTNQKNQYEWSDGSPTDFTAWGPGQPDNNNLYHEESCVEFFNNQSKNYVPQKPRGLWNDQRCDQPRPYLCMRGTIGHVKPPPPIKNITGGCMQGWTAYGEKCYKLVNSQANFFDANNFCHKTGNVLHSDLASIHSAAEQTFVQSLLPATGTNKVWIGAYLNKTYYDYLNWSWIDESVFGDFENWKLTGEEIGLLRTKRMSRFRFRLTTPMPTEDKEVEVACSLLEGNEKQAKWMIVESAQCEAMKLYFICAQLKDPKIPPIEGQKETKMEEIAKIETGPIDATSEKEIEREIAEWTAILLDPSGNQDDESKMDASHTWALLSSESVALIAVAVLFLLVLLFVLVYLARERMFYAKPIVVGSGPGFRKLVEINAGFDNSTKDNLI